MDVAACGARADAGALRADSQQVRLEERLVTCTLWRISSELSSGVTRAPLAAAAYSRTSQTQVCMTGLLHHHNNHRTHRRPCAC